jgi:PIN domain nuclease of toxin-antitoxin system
VSPIRTYLDTNVLIGAARGDQRPSQNALNILKDKNRVFVSSIFSKMETLPIPMRRGNTYEEEFYHTFYADVLDWASNLEQIINKAINLSGSVNIDIWMPAI